MTKQFSDGLTGQQRFDRVPEHGWDSSIDIRHGREYLREIGDTVREIMPGIISAADMAEGKKAPTDEDVIAKLQEDLAPYIIRLRRFGLRPRTVAKELKTHFRGRIGVETHFTMGLLKKLVQHVFVENNGLPGVESMAGERVPDGMAFATNAQGQPFNKPENIAIAFVRLGVSLRYNKFADRYLIDGLQDFGPDLDDAAVQRIRFDISRKYGFLPSRQTAEDFCYDFARYYAFDPVADYFDKAQEKWDGKPRIDRFLIDYAGAEDTPYVRAVSKLFFLSVVKRNRDPGAKFDEMIVLESDQGKDKSSALEVLALKPEWFSDSFPMDASNRETLEHAQGKIIIEVAELQGMRKADIEHVKAMLSRTTDRGRLAYARTPIEQARRFIFVGTSNGRTYLQDPTGNRRFWPVAVKGFKLAAIRRDLVQLWGEAAWRDALGLESIRLDQSLWAAAGIEQDKRLAANDDPFAEVFREYLGDKAGRITSGDAWSILGIEPGRRTPDLDRRFGAALKAIGWRHVTIRLGPSKTARGYGNGNSTRRIVSYRNGKTIEVGYEDQLVTDGLDQAEADFG